jgi:small ligand-binding sensory domain FIST
MRWASAIETDSNLSSAMERAAGSVFAGLGRQEPDLVFVFVGADHAARFDTVTELLLREFESAFVFGCCAGGVIGGGREVEDRPGLSLTGAVLPGVKFKGTHLDAAQVPPVFAESRIWEDTLRMTANQQPAFLLLADPYSFETETYVRGLDRVYPLAPKIGGLASGARQVGGTALYLGNQVYHSGCVTLASVRIARPRNSDWLNSSRSVAGSRSNSRASTSRGGRPSSSRIRFSCAIVTNIGSPIGRQPCATTASSSMLPVNASVTQPEW